MKVSLLQRYPPYRESNKTRTEWRFLSNKGIYLIEGQIKLVLDEGVPLIKVSIS